MKQKYAFPSKKIDFFIFSHNNFTCNFQNLSPPWGCVRFGSDFFLNVPHRLINGGQNFDSGLYTDTFNRKKRLLAWLLVKKTITKP